MGCRPSKAYTSMSIRPNTRDDIVEVQQLIRKLENPSLDAIELKKLISQLPQYFQSILGYLKDNKKTMAKKPKLLSFIKDYLGEENTIAVLNFLSRFNPSIETATGRLADIKSVLQCVVDYEDEGMSDNNKVKMKKVNKAKKKLDKYLKTNVAGEDDSGSELKLLHLSKKKELKVWREKLEQRKKSTKMWRKVYKVAYKFFFVAILVCAVAVAAIHAPPAAITAATAGATIWGAMQPPLDSLWAKRMKVLEAEEQVVIKMERGGGLVKVHELENIRVDMDNMKVGMDKIAGELEFIVRGMVNNEDGIEVDREELEKKVGELEDTIRKVKKMVDDYATEMRKLAFELLKCMLDDDNPASFFNCII